MADVDLTALSDFSYSTRRLKAGDSFTVPAPMAKVLVGIGKAELPREPGNVPAPPPALVQKVVAAAPPVKKVSKPVAAVSTRSADKPKATRRRTKAAAKK